MVAMVWGIINTFADRNCVVPALFSLRLWPVLNLKLGVQSPNMLCRLWVCLTLGKCSGQGRLKKLQPSRLAGFAHCLRLWNMATDPHLQDHLYMYESSICWGLCSLKQPDHTIWHKYSREFSSFLSIILVSCCLAATKKHSYSDVTCFHHSKGKPTSLFLSKACCFIALMVN